MKKQSLAVLPDVLRILRDKAEKHIKTNNKKHYRFTEIPPKTQDQSLVFDLYLCRGTSIIVWRDTFFFVYVGRGESYILDKIIVNEPCIDISMLVSLQALVNLYFHNPKIIINDPNYRVMKKSKTKQTA